VSRSRPDEVDRLRRKVLVQCGLQEGAGDNLPWYFHFEFGRELLISGDAQRAVGELSMAVDLNPVPHASKRMYGMWYVDYSRTYQLALAHSALGNWTCAANAMRLSQLTESASAEHFDMVKIRDPAAADRRQGPVYRGLPRERTVTGVAWPAPSLRERAEPR
jgi:hypothetical protein